MVMGVRGLLEQVEPSHVLVSRLEEILVAAGFEDATDVAMVNGRMAEKILGEEAEALGGGAPPSGYGVGTHTGGVGHQHK